LEERPVLVFDLDDTLYPEWEYVRSGFLAVAAFIENERGVSRERTYAELLACFSADRTARCFDEWLDVQGLARSALLEPMLAAYREHQPALRLFCDARWALGRFAEQYRLALLTDGRSGTQRNKIAALEIAPAFEQILVSDELGQDFRKPGERGLVTLLERLGVPPAQAVYVADNPAKDFVGPRRLGMATVRVRRRCGLYRDAEAPDAEHLPDAETVTLFGLTALLPRLLGTRV
jgi:putative hydrolase of the HAD superfamily